MEWRIALAPVAMLGLEGVIHFQAVDRLTELIKIPQGFSERSLWGGLSQRGESVGHHAHGLNRGIQAMLIEPLQGAPGSSAVLGWRGPCAPETHGIDTARGQGEQRFETAIACPEGPKVLHIPEALAAMEAAIPQPDMARRCPSAAVCPAMDTETVQMLGTPGQQDLQERMQGRERPIALDEHASPDEWADASEDDP